LTKKGKAYLARQRDDGEHEVITLLLALLIAVSK
jgi:hypothetical protein